MAFQESKRPAIRRGSTVNLNASSATIFDRDGTPRFVVQIYGVDSLATLSPDPNEHGGKLVRRALRENGLDPNDFTASPFATWREPRPWLDQ